MNKQNLKISNLRLYRRITGFTASFVLATSLSAVPVHAYTNDVIQPIEIEDTVGFDSNEKEVITDENVTFSGTYDNEFDAENVKNEKEREYRKNGYQNIKSEIVKYDVQEKTGNVIEKYVDSDISFEKGVYFFDNLEDAYDEKERLETSTNTHDVVVKVDINKTLVDSGEYETVHVNKSFSSEEEVEAYLNSLREQGYEVDDPIIMRDVGSSEVLLDQTFNTYEEAAQALNDFQNSYDLVVTDGIVENKTDTVIDTITNNVPYETEDLAWEAIGEFLNDPENETDEYYFTGEVIESVDDSINETSPINERFDSEDEALEYIWDLEEQGYTVNDYTFINDTEEQVGTNEQRYNSFEEAEAALDEFETNYPDADMISMATIEAGTVNDVKPIMTDMKIYKTGKTPYAIIKDDADVYIWTEESLSEDAQTQFKDTYGNVVSDETLSWEDVASENTMFISGYDTFQLFSGKDASFELNEEDDEVQVYMDLDDETYIEYGSYEPITQYVLEIPGNSNIELKSGVLVGEKSRNSSETVYFANFIKKAKTYSVFASGNETVYGDSYNLDADCLKSIMVEQYSLDVTTEVKKYNYYNEVIDGTCYDLTVTADIVQGLNNDRLRKSDREIPPTGDENNMAVPFAGLATSSAILAGFALTKKRKRY